MSRFGKMLFAIIALVLAAGCWYLWRNRDSGAPEMTAVGPETVTQPITMRATGQVPSTTPAPIPAPDPRPQAGAPTVVTSLPAMKSERETPPEGTTRSEPRTQLPAEAGLVTENGVDMKAIGRLMKSDDFNNAIERLSEQSLQEPLAMDLTALTSAVAAEVSRSVPDVSMQRMACGLQVCVALLSATSEESFRQWAASFQSNPSAQVRTMGIHPMTLADGSIEFWLFFSTDPAVNRAFSRPGG
ncbi:MAG: hypothetical protein WBP11_09560 [Dokdonella sp.]